MNRGEGTEFVTPLNLRVLLYPIAINLPVWLQRDPQSLERLDWLGCEGGRPGLDYVLYSGAIFIEQILTHPILQAYDYYLKMDLDVHFLQTIPISPFYYMQQQGCILLHSNYKPQHESCLTDSNRAVESWCNKTGYCVASQSHAWWSSGGYYFGNFMGGWLGWLTSIENRSLMNYLYENSEYPGYFQHRWADQAPMIMMLGMWYNLTDQQINGSQATHTICDLTGWRYGQTRIFEHV